MSFQPNCLPQRETRETYNALMAYDDVNFPNPKHYRDVVRRLPPVLISKKVYLVSLLLRHYMWIFQM